MSNNGIQAAGQAAPEGDEKPTTVAIPTKEELTTHQVSILIHIVNTMRGMCFLEPREHDGAPLSLDREASLAANTTFINACTRLDNLINEPTRWTLSEQREFHDAVIRAHKKQEEVLQANLELLQTAKRPSHVLKPTIATYQDKYFIAVWGNVNEPGAAIVGRGRTPNEALLDFDEAFNRTPKQQIRVINDFFKSNPNEPEKS